MATVAMVALAAMAATVAPVAALLRHWPVAQAVPVVAAVEAVAVVRPLRAEVPAAKLKLATSGLAQLTLAKAVMAAKLIQREAARRATIACRPRVKVAKHRPVRPPA